MLEIIGVNFRSSTKTYYFNPVGLRFEQGDKVVVETSRGMECGDVAIANKIISEEEFSQPLKNVIRKATQEDIEQVKSNTKKEEFALRITNEKIEAHHLDMRLIGAEYAFDCSKVLIFFTSEGRVDFRNLVKDLAAILKTRIELRQIGVRDEAKMLGGLGICGREFCCSTFFDDFQPVSIRMAKDQGLSLNPTKISGTCGRLMCCLKFEQEAYRDLHRITPKQGAYVKTPLGMGVVTDVGLIAGKIKVRVNVDGEEKIEEFKREEIEEKRNK